MEVVGVDNLCIQKGPVWVVNTFFVHLFIPKHRRISVTPLHTEPPYPVPPHPACHNAYGVLMVTIAVRSVGPG